MLAVLYLLFNEGYTASTGADLVRWDLCVEAIRLARLLARLMPDEPEALGLVALMLLHHARSAARVDAADELVTLEHQDRSRWDRVEIDGGVAVLKRAVRQGRPGPYQLQPPSPPATPPPSKRPTPTGRRSPNSTNDWCGSHHPRR